MGVVAKNNIRPPIHHLLRQILLIGCNLCGVFISPNEPETTTTSAIDFAFLIRRSISLDLTCIYNPQIRPCGRLSPFVISVKARCAVLIPCSPQSGYAQVLRVPVCADYLHRLGIPVIQGGGQPVRSFVKHMVVGMAKSHRTQVHQAVSHLGRRIEHWVTGEAAEFFRLKLSPDLLRQYPHVEYPTFTRS